MFWKSRLKKLGRALHVVSRMGLLNVITYLESSLSAFALLSESAHTHVERSKEDFDFIAIRHVESPPPRVAP